MRFLTSCLYSYQGLWSGLLGLLGLLGMSISVLYTNRNLYTKEENSFGIHFMGVGEESPKNKPQHNTT